MGAVSGRTALLSLLALVSFSARLSLLGLEGCRCNSVDDHDLPAAPPASAAPPPSAIAAPLSVDPFKPDECGPDIGGIESIASAPAVVLGELHGLAAAPAFTGDLACRLAFSRPGEGLTLALEIPSIEQGRFDVFLASEGRTADRAALTTGGFWTGTRDGRSSMARLDLIERVRQLNRRGANIRLRAIDGGANRDEAMAKRVIAAVNEKRGPVIVLVGNLHAQATPNGNQKWMGEFVREAVPGVVTLDNRYADGEAWTCSPECGRHPVKARDAETDARWRIELKPELGAYSGVWRIGVARASEPAVPPK